MRILKYFIEYFIIINLFFLFKIIGFKKSSDLGEIIGKIFGPLFRNKKKIIDNLAKANIGIDNKEREDIINSMWGNYGRILSEYPHLKDFRSSKLKQHISINGKEILDDIVNSNKQVVFISGHFSNFELMAMCIESGGVNLAAIYRPLNNLFLNSTMEKIRKNYICKKQIKKGRSGSRELIKLINNGYSVALMIDQRVSEGIPIKFFSEDALTTTIPAQLFKKYKLDIIPVDIKRYDSHDFKISFEKPFKFNEDDTIKNITEKLNQKLENFIKKHPKQWIWTHDRWK